MAILKKVKKDSARGLSSSFRKEQQGGAKRLGEDFGSVCSRSKIEHRYGIVS